MPGAGDLVAKTLGALEQGADDHGVSNGATAAHRVGEVGVGGDPVVDGAGATPKKPASTSLVAPSRQ
jgi:hypothetical protein